MRDALVAVLLVIGVGAQLLGCAGIAVMRDAFDRLHYTAPSMLAAVAIAGALLVRQGFSFIADRGLMLAAIVIVTSPVIVQAIARAARVGDRGSLDAGAQDVERAS
ncbi:MAG: multicomponent Na+:H+ antiporter subunit [Thermoleophilaceae bacterium]|jgi:multisubunit Na+/H+ antiporter MnhG subunit|nr:multicomponent Na+:H+ antiporter subunit [Thermoleophilaceae bacterium]